MTIMKYAGYIAFFAGCSIALYVCAKLSLIENLLLLVVYFLWKMARSLETRGRS